jgi:NADH dehydrogenase/NADH:ubiquinone oxidoreductase subunit G
MLRVMIDGAQYEAAPGRTVLEVAREHRIHIPTLCYHEALEPYGACRLCVVEVEAAGKRRLVTSCTYPCSDGLIVETQSEAALASRRMSIELLLATARRIPLIQGLAAEYGVGEPRFRMAEDDCILCGLCVRACREIVGVQAISLAHRGIDKAVATPFQISSAECIECGTCVYVCPTGAIRLEDINGRSEAERGAEIGSSRRSIGFHLGSEAEPVFLEAAESILQTEGKELETRMELPA